MSLLRYLLDENVDPLYASELIHRDPALVVWRVGAPGAPLKGTSDPDILIWCEAQRSFYSLLIKALAPGKRRATRCDAERQVWVRARRPGGTADLSCRCRRAPR